jgi:hypothetical protein
MKDMKKPTGQGANGKGGGQAQSTTKKNEKNEPSSVAGMAGGSKAVKQEPVEDPGDQTTEELTDDEVSSQNSDSPPVSDSSQAESEDANRAEVQRREYVARREAIMASFGCKIPPIDLDADNLAEQFKLFRY